ncbi:MAG: hypothetical protein NXH72_04315 [Hyphomonadaceae bacterium]|nr:hypothetical protein [Hyphomonadaceae bacterium]
MKRLLACLFIAAAPLSAHASSDLARQWGHEASRLSVETTSFIYALDMGETAEISDSFALDVYRFGRTSADLAKWIDAANGPNDLGCIFRGMANESEDQLIALDSKHDALQRRESLRRLAAMFADAEMIAIAAQRRSPTTGRVATTLKTACAADPKAVMFKLN